MFKSRPGARGNPATPPPQSIEAVRRRARHRLIGAVVLVSLGVLGFPLLFDTQPRPISVDIPIEIPAKNPIPPLKPVTAPLDQPAVAAAPVPAVPAAPSTPAAPAAPANPVAPAVPVAPAPAVPAAQPPASAAEASVSTRESLGAREEVVPAAPSPRPPEPKPVPAPQKADAAKPAATQTQTAEAARAQALLDGQPVATLRVVVQVGAFADAARAQEVRLTLERAGLKTYTHVAQTPDGPRTRVRLGPFASRAEADKAAERVKALGLPAAILTL